MERRTWTCFTGIFVCHRSGLFHKINLEADEISDRTTRLPSNRNHGEQIHKRLAASPVIDQANLSFGPRIDRVLQVQNRSVVDVLSLDAGFYIAIRRLQKSAVPAEDHVSCVSS